MKQCKNIAKKLFLFSLTPDSFKLNFFDISGNPKAFYTVLT